MIILIRIQARSSGSSAAALPAVFGTSVRPTKPLICESFDANRHPSVGLKRLVHLLEMIHKQLSSGLKLPPDLHRIFAELYRICSGMMRSVAGGYRLRTTWKPRTMRRWVR